MSGRTLGRAVPHTGPPEWRIQGGSDLGRVGRHAVPTENHPRRNARIWLFVATTNARIPLWSMPAGRVRDRCCPLGQLPLSPDGV